MMLNVYGVNDVIQKYLIKVSFIYTMLDDRKFSIFVYFTSMNAVYYESCNAMYGCMKPCVNGCM